MNFTSSMERLPYGQWFIRNCLDTLSSSTLQVIDKKMVIFIIIFEIIPNCHEIPILYTAQIT